jgi:transcriptional regulator of acetoin/glycerol metabolism
MQKSATTRHIDEILAYTSGMVPGQDGTGPDDFIRRSWQRCVTDHGLDPTRSQPARIVESTRLREHQERAEGFLRVARGGLEQLFKRVSPLGYVLLLTDADGVTVDYIGNDSWDRELRRSGLYLGADWNEAHAGTCAVGTCIVERAALTCHRVDHFDASHISLTCTAAPLFDPTGAFMGVLDVSALTSPDQRDSQHLARHMTILYAQMIEDANFLRHFGNQWILRLGRDWTLVDVSSESMLAFNGDGTIVGANTGARRTLAAAGDALASRGLVGCQLTDVFRASMDDIWRCARAGNASERTVLTTHSHELLHATVVQPLAAARPPRASVPAPQDGAQDGTQDADFPALDRLAGDDKQMARLIEQAKRLVNKDVNILLHGETGTGKEVVARALHDSSSRRERPFVAVNCASIPESLIESELFGYAPGSFTGGRAKGKRGLILQAGGGTLFLDEIGDMPLHLQTRLLRVISEREVVPLGAETPVAVDLTVVAASHRDLRRLIADGVFREDLYYRLCGATLHLPPLRARTDKTFIIARILRREAEQMGYEGSLSSAALQLMLDFEWPGNIRQLRNTIRFALAVCDDGHIEPAHLPPELHAEAAPAPVAGLVPEPLAQAPEPANAANPQSPAAADLVAVLRRHHWNITAVARELDVCRATVYRHMRRLRIVPPTHQ